MHSTAYEFYPLGLLWNYLGQTLISVVTNPMLCGRWYHTRPRAQTQPGMVFGGSTLSSTNNCIAVCLPWLTRLLLDRGWSLQWWFLLIWYQMTCNFKHPVSRVIVMPCFILCMYVQWEWKHLNTGSMALLRIKSTFLQTEEFVCSRVVQSPHTHLPTEGLDFVCGTLGRILSPGKRILWEWVFYSKSAVTFS